MTKTNQPADARLLLIASLLLAILPAAWAAADCMTYPAGNPALGACTGTFNQCNYYDASKCPTCPAVCSNDVTGECRGPNMADCGIFNNNDACSKVGGCTFVPDNPCSGLGGSCNIVGAPRTYCCSGQGLVCSSSTGGGACKLNIGEPCWSASSCITGQCLGSPCTGTGPCFEETGRTPGVCCVGDNQYCSRNSDCCNPSKVCRTTDAFTGGPERCMSCAAAGEYCGSADDCCSGMSCVGPSNFKKCTLPNQPPAKPPKPEISASPAIPPSSTSHSGTITCNANCPPAHLPADPDGPGEIVTMKYQWYQDGNSLGIVETSLPVTLDCKAVSCSGGSSITLKAIACDQHGACSYSDASDAIAIVPNRPPDPPPVPAISPLRIGKEGSFSCISNCPPPSLPPDPDGDTVSIFYQWHKNGAPVAGQSAKTFDCSANNCAEGDKVKISLRACDNAVPSLCSESFSSEGAIIGPSQPGSGNMNNTYIALALASAVAVLSLAYMAGRLFGIPQMQAIVQDELLQVIATGVVALSLIGVQQAMDAYGVTIVAGSKADVTCTDWNNAATCSTSLHASAQGTLSTLASQAEGLLNGKNGILDASNSLGREASKGVFCNFLGVGFTLINCSQLNAFRGGITIASFAAMAALLDTYAQQFLLSLVTNSGFQLIIPLGLFLRCFKVSRRAGGALVAVGFGFYMVYPSVILATENLLHGDNPSAPASLPIVSKCDPKATDQAESIGSFTGYARQLTDFNLMFNLTYFVLVRVIFLSILNLIITLGFIRAFAHVIGSDIDVSALARIS